MTAPPSTGPARRRLTPRARPGPVAVRGAAPGAAPLRLPVTGQGSGGREGQRATGDGGQDGHRVAIVELGVQRAEEPDVLVVDVDVDEAVQGTLVGDQPGAQAGVPAVQVGEQVGDGVAAALDGLGATGVRAQDGRDANFDCHDDVTPQDSDRNRSTTVSYYRAVAGQAGHS